MGEERAAVHAHLCGTPKAPGKHAHGVCGWVGGWLGVLPSGKAKAALPFPVSRRASSHHDNACGTVGICEEELQTESDIQTDVAVLPDSHGREAEAAFG